MIDFGIIAAGDGNRIKEEGSLVAKPLVEIDGWPMIKRLISIMANCGASSISIIVNSDMKDVWEFLQNEIPSKSCVLKLLQKKTPSSMHTFYELVQLMAPTDKFVVTTVDTIFKETAFRKYIEEFENSPQRVDGVMGVTDFIDDEKPLYIETDKNDYIVSYSDIPIKDSGLVSAGVYGLRKNSIPVLQKCIDSGMNRMRNFQRQLIENGFSLKAFNMGKVLDVDHLSDIAKANEFLNK